MTSFSSYSPFSPCASTARRFVLTGVACVAASLVSGFVATAGAQQTTPPVTTASSGTTTPATAEVDPLFVRAQQLVSGGSGTEGRALVDSVLAATPVAEPRYAEALFWRASLAATAADAERDYRRLAVEFPLSPRSEDALLRLAQMELARGDRGMAMKHLERLTLEHPTGTSRPRAGYWMARILFETGDVTGACSAIASARELAPPEDVELRNQIEFTSRRCARYDAQRPADVTAAPNTTSATTTPTATTPAPAPTPSPASPAPASPTATPVTRPAKPVTKPTASSSYTVQIAAFDEKGPAQALVARLKKRGFTARVDGASAPYRVRIGRYRTREQAVAAQRTLEGKRIAGFVVTEAR